MRRKHGSMPELQVAHAHMFRHACRLDTDHTKHGESWSARMAKNRQLNIIIQLERNHSMVVIKASVQIGAPQDRVWDIVSDLDREPEFWKGTKSVRNISRNGNRVVREVTIAFKDKKCMQEITLEPRNRIAVEFTEGIILGSKSITLRGGGDGTTLEARWDITMSGMMGIFTGMIKKHIRSGTEQALYTIKEKAEG